VIEVADDGGGLNRSKILNKAKERGLPVSDTMSDEAVWMLIFEAGFSTADVITDVSGRGVAWMWSSATSQAWEDALN